MEFNLIRGLFISGGWSSRKKSNKNVLPPPEGIFLYLMLLNKKSNKKEISFCVCVGFLLKKVNKDLYQVLYKLILGLLFVAFMK